MVYKVGLYSIVYTPEHSISALRVTHVAHTLSLETRVAAPRALELITNIGLNVSFFLLFVGTRVAAPRALETGVPVVESYQQPARHRPDGQGEPG